MRIRELLDPRSIRLNGSAKDKADVIDQMVDLMVAGGKIIDRDAYKKGVYEREAEATTSVGDGVAIPHCKSDAVKSPGLSAMTLPDGVDYNAIDGEKVKLLFLIAAPNTKDNVHVDVLSKLSVLLLDENLTKKLLAAKTIDGFLNCIDQAETEKDAEEKKEAPQLANAKANLVAVTACPTGIAHTYMAAESLEKKAIAMGCKIKVETRGASGAQNVLTQNEITEADCVIVAADTKIPMDRFDGKKVIQCKVSDGIGKTEQLINEAMSGTVAVYHMSDTEGTKKRVATELGSESTWHVIYKHLMNGVSHMLPFVVGGGVLIAIAFLIDSLNIDLASIPLAQRSSFGTFTPVAKFFKTLGGSAFGFMLPILAGYIAMSIADRPGLALGFVGGFIAANGKSGFLGALVVGFASGYLILALKKLFSKMPRSMDGPKTILFYPILGLLGIGLLMSFIVEPFVGAINLGLNHALSGMTGTSSVILGLILGGMMSVDMGGPVNKAAYVFGTASIVAGNYNIMASVMVGGMVPPLAIAIATLIFKNKFTAEERKAGPANFVMGFSFITEGAIPYAASDPGHVLPCCIIGSATAGAISMAANCTLMAPHGGIFVFPLVGHAGLYIVALLIGSFVGAVLLGLTKKTVRE